MNSAIYRGARRLFVGLPLLLIIVGGIVLLARPHQPIAARGGLRVVAGENVWGNIASQIGDSHVQVATIINDPSADPHVYEASARDAEAVASADVVVVNGAGYDSFMQKLLNSTQASCHVITISSLLGVSKSEANPHLWYNLPRLPEVTDALAASFAAKDPAHKSDYARNVASFDSSLQPLLRTLARIRQQYGGTAVAYTEPLPEYLLHDAGLVNKTPAGFAKAVEDGDDPSPNDTQLLEAAITRHDIKALLYNDQATSPVTEHIKTLAARAGIPIVGFTETLPTRYATLQQWQSAQLDQILKALQTK